MRAPISILILFLSISLPAQIPYDFVKDLNQEWMFEKEGRLYPYLGESAVQVIHFQISNEDCNECQLLVINPAPATLYLNFKPVELLAPGTHFFPMDSLMEEVQSSTGMMALYTNDPTEVTTYLVKNRIDPERFRTSSQIFATPLRIENNFQQFFIISLILILGLIAILRNIYPKMFGEFFILSRTVSTRNIDEVLFKTRFFDTYNLWMLFLHALIFSFLLLTFSWLSDGTLIRLFEPESTYLNMLLRWLLLALFMMVLYTFKNVLIGIFELIYRFDFRAIHFYNYMRYSAIVGMGALVVVAVFFMGLDLESGGVYKVLIYIVAGLFLIRSVLILLKLMSAQSNTFLHLFSYLCATELIPFFFVVNVIFRG